MIWERRGHTTGRPRWPRRAPWSIQGRAKPEVMREFGIASKSPLDSWCRKYRECGAEALRPKPKGRPKGAEAAPATREQQLEREVRRLEAQVAYLKKSIALKAELGLLPGRGPRP